MKDKENHHSAKSYKIYIEIFFKLIVFHSFLMKNKRSIDRCIKI